MSNLFYQKALSNWKAFKAKVLDDLTDIIKFKNNDLSIWLFKKYYEEESEKGRNYLSAELINAGSEFIYTSEVCSMLQDNIRSNFRTIFKLSCYFEKFNIVDNLIKIDCENYLQVNFHYCCVEIIKNDRKFEFEKLKLIKELLKLKNLDLDVYELSNLIEMCLMKSHKTIFKLFMDEFSSYKKDVLKIIFTKTELFKIDIVTANLILYLDKEELNKNRIFTFQQIAKNKDIKVELLENIEYFISKPFSEKEINSIIWISVACENYEFLNNIFFVIELTKESEKFLFFTFDSFWGKAKFYECINKGFLKTKEHDNFEIHDRLKDFFIRSRNLKSCLVNIEDSEVVLNLAKESGSKLILELVEFILDYKSIN